MIERDQRKESSKALRRALLGTAGGIILTVTGLSSALATEAVFKTPEDALQAFRAAVDSPGGEGLLQLFGPEHKDDLLGGDPAAVRQGLADLRAALASGATLERADDTTMTVVIGRQAWPMPVPLVKTATGWSFDVDAGLEEINDRRIGRNELAAIAFCQAYMNAQPEYASADHDGDRVLEYAQRIESTPGAKDGLYWEAGVDGELSPFTAFVADAADYLAYRQAGEPYRGYNFRVLTAQGANPPGGAYSFVINGHMIAGYGLIAWPADYGRSGIMTFLCGHHGEVLEKDLGPDTATLAASIKAYDPDASWVPAQE